MENTYTMIALDGAQYGPVSLEQMRGWVDEGRVAANTKILRSDTKSWLPASEYAELELSAETPAIPEAPAPAPITPVRSASINPMAERRMRIGAQLFFWIAGFSLINTFSGRHFVFGLGITQVIDSIGGHNGFETRSMTMINLMIAGGFALLGVLAYKGQGWSFLLGMVLYALDALIFLAGSIWLGLAFHVYLLYRIFLGWKAYRELQS